MSNWRSLPPQKITLSQLSLKLYEANGDDESIEEELNKRMKEVRNIMDTKNKLKLELANIKIKKLENEKIKNKVIVSEDLSEEEKLITEQINKMSRGLKAYTDPEQGSMV